MNLSKNGKWGIAAVAVVALVAAGAAFAATKIHSSDPSARGGGGFGGAPPAAMGGYGRPGFPGGRDRGPGGDLSAAATYLGIDRSTLFDDLRSGKTLAQIANATSGKSASGLIDALVRAAQAQLGSSAPSAAELKTRITALVNGTAFRGPPGRRGGAPPSGTPPPQL